MRRWRLVYRRPWWFWRFFPLRYRFYFKLIEKTATYPRERTHARDGDPGEVS